MLFLIAKLKFSFFTNFPFQIEEQFIYFRIQVLAIFSYNYEMNSMFTTLQDNLLI